MFRTGPWVVQAAADGEDRCRRLGGMVGGGPGTSSVICVQEAEGWVGESGGWSRLARPSSRSSAVTWMIRSENAWARQREGVKGRRICGTDGLGVGG